MICWDIGVKNHKTIQAWNCGAVFKVDNERQQIMTCFTSRFANILSKMSETDENDSSLEQTCNLAMQLFELNQ